MEAIVYYSIAVMVICVIITCILFYLYNKETTYKPKYEECKTCKVFDANLSPVVEYIIMREQIKEMYRTEMVEFEEYRKIDNRLSRKIWRLKFKEAKDAARKTHRN